MCYIICRFSLTPTVAWHNNLCVHVWYVNTVKCFELHVIPITIKLCRVLKCTRSKNWLFLRHTYVHALVLIVLQFLDGLGCTLLYWLHLEDYCASDFYHPLIVQFLKSNVWFTDMLCIRSVMWWCRMWTIGFTWIYNTRLWFIFSVSGAVASYKNAYVP